MVWVVPLLDKDLSTLALTPDVDLTAFGVHLDSVGCDTP